jgi:rhamnose transport system substrate-binding protein
MRFTTSNRVLRRVSVLAQASALALFGALGVAGCGQQPAEQPPTNTTSTPPTTTAPPSGKKITVLMVPKWKGRPYWESTAQGAKKAADELGVNLIYDGPTDGSPQKAAAIIEQHTKKGGVDVIAVAPDDPDVLAPAMKAARAKGIHVITFDADAEPETREFFVNQATPQQIGTAFVDTMAKDIGGSTPSGDVAIITYSLTSPNQNEWIKALREQMKKYPKLNLIGIKPAKDQKLAIAAAQGLIKTNPNLKGIFAISHTTLLGAAEGVKQSGKAGKVMVVGPGSPSSVKAYITGNVVKSIATWNTKDLGALTVQVAQAVANGSLKAGQPSFEAGSLGKKQVQGDNVLLGDILVINKGNISQYDF